MIPRQTAVVEMVVLLLLLMSWDATAATVKAAHDDEQMSLRPSRKEGRFLRVRASRPPVDLQLEFSPSKESSSFLSTNDEEVEEEGKRTEGLDWSALEAFHKDISSEQYTREGGMIWNQRTLIFISSS